MIRWQQLILLYVLTIAFLVSNLHIHLVNKQIIDVRLFRMSIIWFFIFSTMLKYDTKTIINKFMEVHGSKYDYSKFVYNGILKKGIIICLKHGKFLQSAHDHLRGNGCNKCYFENKLNVPNEELNKVFIEKAQEVHHGEYDYSCVDYHNNNTKVFIKHIKCGNEFWQTPKKHLQGQGCPYCSKTRKNTTDSFIEKAKKIHSDEFDYNKVNYVNNLTKVCVFHKKCGKEFYQTPHNHLKGRGCPYCCSTKSALTRTKTTNDFIKRAKEIHGDKYDYSKVAYINSKQKVCIICSIHGNFLQTPSSHLIGHGCPKCNQSKMEKVTEIALIENHLKFVSQKRFVWLGQQSLDFYLPEYKTGIECQGEQHFKPVDFEGKNNQEQLNNLLNENILRDEKKFGICKENGVKIYYLVSSDYYSYNSFIYQKENTFNDIIELIKNIL